MNVNPNSVALFRTQTSSQRSGSTAGDEGLAARLTVLCFCAINIVYGFLGDGDIHLKRGKKRMPQTHTLENFRKLPKSSNPSRGQWFSIGVYMINPCSEYI